MLSLGVIFDFLCLLFNLRVEVTYSSGYYYLKVHFDCLYGGITVVSSRESNLLAGNWIIAQVITIFDKLSISICTPHTTHRASPSQQNKVRSLLSFPLIPCLIVFEFRDILLKISAYVFI